MDSHMKSKPILFSSSMVRALLTGHKTQTRRAVKPQPPEGTYQVSTWHHPDPRPHFFAWQDLPHGTAMTADGWVQPCPYGQPGERLWVRETHYLTDDGHSEFAVYAADDDAAHEHLQRLEELNADFPADVKAAHKRLRPSIHMPRWASRILLEIVSVRVERLQDISEDDAMAEGIDRERVAMYAKGSTKPAMRAYADLWNSINGDGSWDVNPWVFVIEFKRISP